MWRAAAPSTGFSNGLDPAGLSRDPEVVKAYREDPSVHDKISPRLYHEYDEARQRCMREARQLQVPTLMLQARRRTPRVRSSLPPLPRTVWCGS